MKQIYVVILLPITLLGGCVTAVSAEERTRCEEMARRMGTRTIYTGQTKGNATTPMNLSHRRCRQILAQPE